jgi:hypothetical protein
MEPVFVIQETLKLFKQYVDDTSFEKNYDTIILFLSQHCYSVFPIQQNITLNF